MTTNPTCSSDTVDISGCSSPFQRLLYAKVTNVSGCSAYDGKTVQLLHDSTSGKWCSDDDDLVIDYSITSTLRTLTAKCVGDFLFCASTDTDSGCTTPVDDSYSSCELPCCGSVDIHIGVIP